MHDDFNKMHSLLQESLRLKHETGSVFLYNSLLFLGIAELHKTHPSQAALHFKECLQISTASDDVAASLIGIAGAALQTNQPWIATQMLGAARRLIDMEIPRLGSVSSVSKKEYDRGLSEAKKQLDEASFEQAWAAGQAMTREQAVAYALEVNYE